MRITEPLVKAYLALWLSGRGAERVVVSVDGAESNPSRVQQVLKRAGYSHLSDTRSSVQWTGRYVGDRCEIVVISRPGIDVDALFSQGRRWVAECKGEPTEKGAKAGRDRTGFHAALGQLIMMAGALPKAPDAKILAMPARPGFSKIARRAAENDLLRRIGVSLVLVDENGRVTKA